MDAKLENEIKKQNAIVDAKCMKKIREEIQSNLDDVDVRYEQLYSNGNTITIEIDILNTLQDGFKHR